MRKKKLILAMLIALCTTGCTVDYNLVIEDNKIKETTYNRYGVDSFTKTQIFRDLISEHQDKIQSKQYKTKKKNVYVKYAVISQKPEEDAIHHMKEWADAFGIENPEIIGWDFSCLSQEQVNVYHMHGYEAACILPEDVKQPELQIMKQEKQLYAVISIKEPFDAPFVLIPNAYKTLGYYIEINGMKEKRQKGILPCFEKTYEKNGIVYMNIHIAVEDVHS